VFKGVYYITNIFRDFATHTLLDNVSGCSLAEAASEAHRGKNVALSILVNSDVVIPAAVVVSILVVVGSAVVIYGVVVGSKTKKTTVLNRHCHSCQCQRNCVTMDGSGL